MVKREKSFLERMNERMCHPCQELMMEIVGDNGKKCLYCTKCRCTVGGTLSDERKAQLGFAKPAS